MVNPGDSSTKMKNSKNVKKIYFSDRKALFSLIPDSPAVICLCGQMAAGKNFVAERLCSTEKCVSIDLDKTVHAAIKCLEPQILQTFAEDAKKAGLVLQNQDKSLNRRALGSLVFSSPALLKKQENLVYPKTVFLVKQFLAEHKDRTVLLNATVLYKTPELMNLCSKIYFVTAPFVKRLLRARRRDGLPLMQILRRFNAQKKLLAEYKKTEIPLILIKN